MKTVLIVDDNPFVLNVLNMMLKPNGYKVLEAESVQAAKRIVENNPIDLLITHLYMPHDTGFTLINWMRELDPLLPIVVVSAGMAQQMSEHEQNTLAKANAVIEQPFRAKGLLSVLNNFMVA